MFISEESIAGGAPPKYTTRPRVLRGTGKGSFMETGGRREEGGKKGKAKEGNRMDSIGEKVGRKETQIEEEQEGMGQFGG